MTFYREFIFQCSYYYWFSIYILNWSWNVFQCSFNWFSWCFLKGNFNIFNVQYISHRHFRHEYFLSSGFRNSNKKKKLMTVLIFTHPFPVFTIYSVTCIISVFYARRTGTPLTTQCAVMHYYILTRFIAKSNAFLNFYRKT